MYSAKELEQLRAAISVTHRLIPEQVRQPEAATAAMDLPPHLAPFGELAGRDSALFAKIAADSLLAAYGWYALFPDVYDRIYGQGQRPEISFGGRTRGKLAIFRFDDGAGLVVKPAQSRREPIIATVAGDIAAGPAQGPALEGFLMEEWVAGRFFTEIHARELIEDGAYRIGRQLGEILASLHSREICYNDATISDPEGRSHLIVEPTTEPPAGDGPGCRLIDFGISVSLDNFPNLEPEEVYNLVRVTPEFRLLSRMGLAGSELRQFLVKYRSTLASRDKEEILTRDLRFTQEGIRQAARRLGTDFVAVFSEGFAKGYGEGRLGQSPSRMLG